MKYSTLLFTTLISTCLLISCQKQMHDIDNFNGSTIYSKTAFHSPEEAFPGEEGVIETGYLFGQRIEYVRINGQAVFQGDIILTEEQLSTSSITEGQLSTIKLSEVGTYGAATTSKAKRWPHHIVYYHIDPNLPNQERVTSAITHWQANTNLRFVQRTPQKIFINSGKFGYWKKLPNIIFKPGNGCSSAIGMTGSWQNITLGPDCNRGSVIHEIGHAVGLFHEQCRSDRNDYITINTSNIQKGKEHNFKTFGSNGFNHGVFDFGSIMMYGPFAFAKDNTKPTITKLDGSTYGIQREGLSLGDRAVLRFIYPTLLGADAIQAKWVEFQSGAGPLGNPNSDVMPTFDGIGRFRNFQRGVISWHPETGAQAIWGAIFQRWLQIGREEYGYSITDELPTPDGRGRFNHFRQIHLDGKPEASIYWTPEYGANEINDAIRAKWAEMGWETSYLGYPTSKEIDFPGSEGGRIQRFERGFLYWTPQFGVTDNVPPPSGPLNF